MSKTAALQVHHPFFVLFFVFCFLCFVFCFVFFFFFFFFFGGGGGGPEGVYESKYSSQTFLESHLPLSKSYSHHLNS